MLTFLGFAMVITFMYLIMTKRLSALIALILVPILFAVFGGLGQGDDDGRLAADAVERLFDGQDMGVRRSQLDEVFYRFKGFIGMMDYDVPFGNGRPEIRRVDGGQFRRRLRRHRRIAQVIVAVDADEGEDKIAKKARLEELEPMEVVQYYLNRYHEAMAGEGRLPFYRITQSRSWHFRRM